MLVLDDLRIEHCKKLDEKSTFSASSTAAQTKQPTSILQCRIKVVSANLSVVLGLLLIPCVVLGACNAKASDKKKLASSNLPYNYTTKTLEYAPTMHDRAHKMDLYIPKRAQIPMPVVILLHGGGWEVGDKLETPAVDFMDHGLAVASINYRYSEEGIFPAQIFDVKAAVRFLRANGATYGLDSNKIGVFGFSAGGHLAALLGTSGGIKNLEGNLGNLNQRSDVQAVVDWSGPTDLVAIALEGERYKRLKLDEMEGPVAKLLGGLPSKNKKLAADASPVTYIDSRDPPFLIMHGENDTVVPLKQSEEFYRLLRAHNVKAEFKIIKDSDHDILRPDTLKVAEDFLAKNLR
ncbi:MAG TPA: alpha/beta hydrolase [Drouetiella sp.]